MLKKLRERVHVLWLKHRGKLIPAAFGIGTGVVIGGALTALADHKRINDLEESVDIHTECLDIARECVDMVNEHEIEDRRQINELVRQTNLLFEKALKETEGEAE